MAPKRLFTDEEAREIGETLGIDWAVVDLGQFRRGLEVELEHGAHEDFEPATNRPQYGLRRPAWASRCWGRPLARGAHRPLLTLKILPLRVHLSPWTPPVPESVAPSD